MTGDHDGISEEAVVPWESTDVSQGAENAALMGALPDLGVDIGEILEGLERDRAER